MTEMLDASNFENSNSWNLEGTAEEDFDEADLLDDDTFIQSKNDPQETKSILEIPDIIIEDESDPQAWDFDEESKLTAIILTFCELHKR